MFFEIKLQQFVYWRAGLDRKQKINVTHILHISNVLANFWCAG